MILNLTTDSPMRKFLYSLAAVLVLFSCTRLETPEALSLSPDSALLEPEESRMAPPGEPTTIFAGYGEDAGTRARIQPEGSTVNVLWTKGDSFVAIYDEGQRYYRVLFTTQDDGVKNASFTTNYSLEGDEYHCFFPDLSKRATVDGERVYGLNLPVEQTAVAGGTEEKLNRAYAYSKTLTPNLSEPLRFYNVPALIKFRLSGAVVPQVRQITFYGPVPVAGDQAFHQVGNHLERKDDIHFTGEVSSNKVILKGTFEAGKDYYIVLWPGELSWFRMEFSDGAGSSTLKKSSKALTLERSRTKDFGTIDLGDSFAETDDGSLGPIKYHTATKGTKPVTIAVIPEGFTKAELPQYEQLAKSGIDALLETEPYKTYADRINVYILKVASRESGASITDGNGTVTTRVDTYFGARWGQDAFKDMVATDEVVFDFVKEKCPDIQAGIHTIDEVPVLMIINDKRYGGKCWCWSSGRAYGMVPYTYGGEGIRWSYPAIVPTTDNPLPTPVTEEVLRANCESTPQAELDALGTNVGDWRNTLVHEFGGHAFGRLEDEYWSDDVLNYLGNPVEGHSWDVQYGLNLSASSTSVPWQDDLMAHRDELVQRDANYGRIGIYQGGGTYLYGRWRSEKISCMIDNRFYFSAWQRYLITRRIFTLSGDAADFSYAAWLAADVTSDPVRDRTGLAAQERSVSGPIHEGAPLPPPGLVE